MDRWKSLERDGYIALPGIVEAKHLTPMRRKLEQLLATTPQQHAGKQHAGTLIVGGLIEHPEFDMAWNQTDVIAAIRSVLGEDPLLLGVSSRGIRPGHGQQALHTDWGGQGQPGVWYLCHAICALVDFTESNGATRVIPGSHKNPWLAKGIRDPRQRHPAEVQLIGKAGTIFILNVHCLHSAVQNNSDHDRLAIFSSFTRRDSPLLTMASPHVASLSTLDRVSPSSQRLLTIDDSPRD
ncbi:MAG: phytanoyl-CoA dioxygenase family protein [Pirellulales bacterium]